MNRAKGFTLIELVVVIVILGILSITAAPRMISLRTDAQNSTLLATKGAVESAISLSNSKLVIAGEEKNPSLWTLTGQYPEIEAWCASCYFMYGYPGNMHDTFVTLVQNIEIAGNSSTSDLVVGAFRGEASSVFGFKDDFDSGIFKDKSKGCYVEYIAPSVDGETPHQLRFVPCA